MRHSPPRPSRRCSPQAADRGRAGAASRLFPLRLWPGGRRAVGAGQPDPTFLGRWRALPLGRQRRKRWQPPGGVQLEDVCGRGAEHWQQQLCQPAGRPCRGSRRPCQHLPVRGRVRPVAAGAGPGAAARAACVVGGACTAAVCSSGAVPTAGGAAGTSAARGRRRPARAPAATAHAAWSATSAATGQCSRRCRLHAPAWLVHQLRPHAPAAGAGSHRGANRVAGSWHF